MPSMSQSRERKHLGGWPLVQCHPIKNEYAQVRLSGAFSPQGQTCLGERGLGGKLSRSLRAPFGADSGSRHPYGVVYDRPVFQGLGMPKTPAVGASVLAAYPRYPHFLYLCSLV